MRCFWPAAKVGGILANDTYPADFLYDNLILEANIIHGAHKVGVEKLMFLGSSCIYPKFADQPIIEDALLTGSARADQRMVCDRQNRRHQALRMPIASSTARTSSRPCRPISMARATISTSNSSHVMPALIRKAHEAKLQRRARKSRIWGTGTPLPSSCMSMIAPTPASISMKTYSAESHVNVGSGEDITILELAGTGLQRPWASRARSSREPDQTRRHAAQAA